MFRTINAPFKKLMFNPQSTVEWWSNPEVPLFLKSGVLIKVNHSTVPTVGITIPE